MESNIEGYTGTQLTNVTISASGYTGTKVSGAKNTTSYTPTVKLENVKIQTYNFDMNDITTIIDFNSIGNYEMNMKDSIRGFYGANQNNPIYLFEYGILEDPEVGPIDKSSFAYKHAQTLLTIFEKNGITEESDMYYFLHVLKGQGCGYSAISNIVVDYYKNDPDAFYKKFGYPLYEKYNGIIIANYDYLVLDLFLQMNEYGQNDYAIRYDGMEECLKNSFDDKEVTVMLCPCDNTIATYKQYVLNGEYDYAVIAVSDFDLYPTITNPQDETHMDGGHWMTITQTNYAMDIFIVSSWGYQWELLGNTPYIETQDGGLILIKIGDK